MDRQGYRLPSLFRKKDSFHHEAQAVGHNDEERGSQRAGDHGVEGSHREDAASALKSQPQNEPAARAEEPVRPTPAGPSQSDVIAELQAQLQIAVSRINSLETKYDRALRDSSAVKQQRDELLTSLAEAEARAITGEREVGRMGKEVESMKKEVGEERERREEAERELEVQRQKVELLNWKMQEEEEHAVGLRSIAAQAESSVELARAEIHAIEAKANEEVERVREEAKEEVLRMRREKMLAEERVVWLEEELLAVKDRVALAEFRLREEASRAEALVAEADDLTERLKKSQNMLEAHQGNAGKAEFLGHEVRVSPRGGRKIGVAAGPSPEYPEVPQNPDLRENPGLPESPDVSIRMAAGLTPGNCRIPEAVSANEVVSGEFVEEQRRANFGRSDTPGTPSTSHENEAGKQNAAAATGDGANLGFPGEGEGTSVVEAMPHVRSEGEVEHGSVFSTERMPVCEPSSPEKVDS